MTGINERTLCRSFGSRSFLIPTRQICDLHAKVNEWIQNCTPGGIVIGPSRVGKSSAIVYISAALREAYGNELPVYIYTATDHTATRKAFYESLLMMLDHDDVKGTANMMRQRVVSRIVSQALNTTYRMAVLWIDEAYLLTDKETVWLSDLYNELAFNDIQLTTILVGTRELLALKQGYIKAGKQQIVQRFMLKEAEFHGIESLSDLVTCLTSLDNQYTPDGYDEPICLSETYFPDAYLDGKTLVSFAPDFWTAVQNLRKANNIGSNFITMKCFMDTVLYVLRKFGADAGDNRLYQPSVESWEIALISSEYVSSQVF